MNVLIIIGIALAGAAATVLALLLITWLVMLAFGLHWLTRVARGEFELEEQETD